MTNDLTSLSATEMAERIRRKQCSPLELLQAHLARIERLNPRLNAFVALRAEQVLEEARAAEAALGRTPSPPLLGVPVTIKSAIDVAGLRCETGMPLRAGTVAPSDAPLVARLKAAGALVLGNTNVAECLMAYETDNPLYGRTCNPWDLARTPGGSSGGEAAAIAAGCSAAGIGSDGGGSIRVPAHFCGLCGLKPTPGRIPWTGHVPPVTGPFALIGVVGPMARTVADLRALFEATAGLDWTDAAAVPLPVRQVTREEAQRLRVGFFEDDGRIPVTPETRAAVRTAAEALARAGLAVAPFSPQGLEEARRLWGVFFAEACLLVLGPMMNGGERELPILKEYLLQNGAAPPVTAQSFLQAQLDRDTVRAQFLAQMEEFPVFLCPVAAVPAFSHGERSWRIDGREVGYLDAMSYTQWFNLLGLPAAVVPVGRSPQGLPIGVQVVGRPFEDEIVLAVAREIERECGGWQPPAL